VKVNITLVGFEFMRFLLILANKIHMTKDTKELLDKTGRFLIEKRGTMHIKV
jgi:hypothetical protein